VLVGLSVQLVSRAGEKAPDIIQPRNGVANFCRDLVNSLNLEKVAGRRKILFFGHHFLYAPDYTPAPHLILKPVEAQGKKFTFGPSLCYTLFHDLVPGSEVSRQTSTTDLPSWNGAMHIKSHGILLWTSGGFPPDTQLVVLDFANNDRGLSEATVCAGLEGMLRQIWEVYPAADILFLYTPSRTFLNDYRGGKEPESIRLHEKVAAHYGLPSVNLARLIADKIIAGELKEADVFLGENVVSDAAGVLCLAAVKPLFQAGLAAAKAAPELEKRVAPPPLSRHPIVKPLVESYNKAQYEPGWLDWQPSPIEQYLHVLHGETSGPVVTVRFKGDLLGISCVVGPDSGDVEVSVDGSAWTLKPCFKLNAGGAFKNVAVLLAEGMDPAVEHTVKLRVAAAVPEGSTGKQVCIANLLVNGTIVSEDPFKGMTALQRIDAIYASLEPLKYVPPADRWKHIPAAMKKLEEGPALNLVLLGDSIINDTSDSQFELLLGRMYPKCKVKKVTSVRSSTGCDWYKQENRVEDYVLKHQPDLLIIGGISNRGTNWVDAAESVREVVRQVRAARPATEMVLMTGPFGLDYLQNPKIIRNWQEVVTPEGTDYRSLLMKVALEEKAEFIDMNGILGRYLLDSKYPYGSFQRDPIHANWRGKQVVGRIIEKYFAPK
jgi:hypothetical protein